MNDQEKDFLEDTEIEEDSDIVDKLGKHHPYFYNYIDLMSWCHTSYN